MSIRTLIGLTLLFFCLLALSSEAAPKPDSETQPPTTWNGLLHKEAAAILPNKVAKKLPTGPFTTGLITSAKQLQLIEKASVQVKGRKPPEWKDWKIDWKKQAIVYVVLTRPTNRVTFASLSGPAKGQVDLKVKWSGIEPFYGAFFPATFCVIDKKNIERVSVRVDDAHLAQVRVP